MGIISFLINDVKEDFKCLYKLVADKEYRMKAGKIINEIGAYIPSHLGEIIKSAWIWYLIIIFAFACGWVFASAYYQTQCNQIIIDRFNDTIIPTAKDMILPVLMP